MAVSAKLNVLQNQFNDASIRWVNDPKLFVYEALNLKSNPAFRITDQQAEYLDALGLLVKCKIKKHKGFPMSPYEEEIARKIGISAMSGKGCGKTAVASWGNLWFSSLFPSPNKIICTSTARNQLKDVLWPEMKYWLSQSPLKGLYDVQAEKIEQISGKKRGEADAPPIIVQRTINANSSVEEQTSALSGRHAPYMMILGDEATGIKDKALVPLETTMTGICNFMVLLFNPTRETGFAIESHGRMSHRWITLNWSAEDSPLVSKEQIKYMEEKYGRDSNAFRMYVLGQPPVTSDDTLIPPSWVEEAIAAEEYTEAPEGTPLIFGVDIGGGKDKTVIYKRRGPVCEGIVEINSDNQDHIVDRISRHIDEDSPQGVGVDNVGLGWGVASTLSNRFPNIVRKIIGQAKAIREDKFVNRRAELLWKVREEFKNKSISIPNDDELRGELCNIKFTEPKGRVQIEGKKEMKKRGLASPNKTDALSYSYYIEDSLVRQVRSSRVYRPKFNNHGRRTFMGR